MRLLQQLYNVYVNASIHVGLAVSALLLVSELELGLSPAWGLVALLFFSTVVSYNLVKYGGYLKNGVEKLPVERSLLLAISALSALMAALLFLQQPAAVQWILVVAALLTFLYGFPFGGGRSLRALKGLKIFIVALVWAMVTVLVPWLAAGVAIESSVWPVFCQRMLAVVLLTIPFEIRDMDRDDRSLGTMPQWLGVKGAKWLGTLFAILYTIIQFFRFDLDPGQHLASLTFIAVALVMLWLSRRNSTHHFTAFWVESLPLLWLAMLYFLRN
jgi:hypothetical protein